MLVKWLAGLAALAVTSALDSELLTLTLKGNYDYKLDLLSQFYIPSGQCSGLLVGDMLLKDDCILRKNTAVQVSVRDSPQYASVEIDDTLETVTIRRRENKHCEGNAVVTVEVQCKSQFPVPSRRSGSLPEPSKSESWRYRVALPPAPPP